MSAVATDVVVPSALHEILLGYLRAAGEPVCPGADGLTLADAVAAYPRAAAAGHVPELRELLAKHPDLRDLLTAFFAGHPLAEPEPLIEEKEEGGDRSSAYSGA